MELSPNWEFVADTVMGGVSTGSVSLVDSDGNIAARLTGAVSLDNNGGFVQMAFDVRNDGSAYDASGWSGLELTLRGNGEAYDLRLRTTQLKRPWQSFRAEFVAPKEWTTLRIPFTAFRAHKTDATFDPAQLRRIGVLAIGREFDADIAVSGIGFYRSADSEHGA